MSACPPMEKLLAYTLGRLDESLAREIAEHLDECSACEQTAASLDRASDTLISQLRRPTVTSPYDQEQEYAAALTAAQKLGRASSLTAPSFSPMSNHLQQDPSHEVEPGSLREYRLLTKLGQGGMGAVYKAVHTKLDREVAIKVLPAERMQDPAAVARFEREMKAVGRLEHPNIIAARDAGEFEGKHYLVMEYIPGCDLSQLVRRHGPLPVADACELIRQAALGLAHAHEHGLVHRDVKPSNLLLTVAGEVKVLDLGLARLTESEALDGELTTTGQVMGTLDYMAPEQAGDSHEADHRADIYSLGAALYKLLTGKAPFSDAGYNTPIKKLSAVVGHAPPPLTSLRPEAPAELEAIVQQMTAKNAADRYASAAEVAAALAPFCSGAAPEELYREPTHDDASSDRAISLTTDSPAAAPSTDTCPDPIEESFPSMTVQPRTARSSKRTEQGVTDGTRRRVWLCILAAIPLLVVGALAAQEIIIRIKDK